MQVSVQSYLDTDLWTLSWAVYKHTYLLTFTNIF